MPLRRLFEVGLRVSPGEIYIEKEWDILRSPSPQQCNSHDCRGFLLTTSKAIALGLEPTAYRSSDILLLRKKIVAELVKGGLKGKFDARSDTEVNRL